MEKKSQAGLGSFFMHRNNILGCVDFYNYLLYIYLKRRVDNENFI